MIKRFLEFSGDRKWLDEEDVVLCICDLLDEGFIFDYQITDDGENAGEIHIYNESEGTFMSNGVFAVLHTENVWETDRNLSDYQRKIWAMVLDSCQKLSDISGNKYVAEVDFAYAITIITFNHQ